MLENQFAFESESASRSERRRPPIDLRGIQHALNRVIGSKILPDGVMTSNTRRALKRFQRLSGLPGDGALTRDTVMALLDRSAPSSGEYELNFEGGGVTKAGTCGSYEPGEVRKSETEAGILPADFFPGPTGYFVLADFAVGSSLIKRAGKDDPGLRNWLKAQLQIAAKDPSIRLRILGYTDCVNKENRNTKLRAERARQVRRLLERIGSHHPGWRVLDRGTKDGAAPPDQYLRDNSNPTNRATNRGVSLEVTTVKTMEPMAVDCKADFLHRALNLLQTARANQLMGAARLNRVLSIVRKMQAKGTNDKYVTEADVSKVALYGLKSLTWRRVTHYLDDVCAAAEKKNMSITDDEILHELWRLDNGFMNGICRLLEFKQNRATTRMRASIVALIDTVFGLMKNPVSVYLGYQNAESECPTRSKPVVIIKKKPTKKDDPKIIHDPGFQLPTPKNQIIPPPTGGGSSWLWDGLKGVAAMGSTFVSTALAAVPTPVLEKAVFGAWALFQLRNLTPTMALGLAGEKAAQVLAEWALGKAGINPDLLFDLNSIRKNFPGFDFIHPTSGISVKAYGVVGKKLIGEALEKQVILKYREQLAKLVGNSYLDRRYQLKIAKAMLQNRGTMGRSWPTALAGNVTEEAVAEWIRNNSQIMIPSDHVPYLNKYEGTRLYNEYKKGGLPGIPANLPLKEATSRINDLVVSRIKPLGIRTDDLKLILELADRLPSLQNSVITGGKRNWPSNWGTPPTWSGQVLKTK